LRLLAGLTMERAYPGDDAGRKDPLSPTYSEDSCQTFESVGRAILEHIFESWYASRATPASAALLERVRDAGRSEAQAAARRLVAVGELFVLRCRDSGEQADWAMDTWEAVAAQVAAVLQCSIAMGSSYLRYAMALRDRLPQVGEAFAAGDIDYRAFQTVVFRTDLITDADVLARVDARLAVRLSRCPTLTRGRLAAEVDKVVAALDRDAVRRTHEAVRDRFVDIDTADTGMAFVTGSVLATAGRALDRRLQELAGVPVSSAAPMPWARWPPARNGWCAAAGLLIARPRQQCRLVTW
jgi:hypothetical protein